MMYKFPLFCAIVAMSTTMSMSVSIPPDDAGELNRNACKEVMNNPESTRDEITRICEPCLSEKNIVPFLDSVYDKNDTLFLNLLNLLQQLNTDVALEGYEALYNIIGSRGDFEDSNKYFLLASYVKESSTGTGFNITDRVTTNRKRNVEKGERLLEKFPRSVRAIIVDGVISIEMVGSRQVLDSDYNGGAYTKTQNGGDYQKWKALRVNGGLFSFQNYQTNKILDSNSKKQVYTTPYNGGNNQKWTLISVSGGTRFALLNAATGYALDANGRGDLYTGPYTHDNYWQHWHSWNA